MYVSPPIIVTNVDESELSECSFSNSVGGKFLCQLDCFSSLKDISPSKEGTELENIALVAH